MRNQLIPVNLAIKTIRRMLSIGRTGVSIALLIGGVHLSASAAPNTFQVGTDTIHSTFTFATYDEFALAPPFEETPAVFILGNVAGNNSCEVRMQNIGLTSFEAVCAEDSSWDGEHVDVPIQFAAITEGVKTIPTNNGGQVTFEVGCVETTRVQHNCTVGCAAESYEPIVFSAGFTNPPVVIANIQTTNNATLGAPPSNPVEPMLSTAVDNITNAGFNLALDLNKEDNVGRIRPEKICWLAVEETSQCDIGGTDNTLNFSSIGGPASVAFESIITPENIDGWDNGCNNTEEATFTPGCFTSTPVAIATKRSRNEAEGWLRYCTLNSGELRITIDEQRVAGQNREHVDETASVIAFGSSFTTPVTLSRFSSEQQGVRRLSFEWETESESFNIGFHLWAEIDGEWVQLNRRLIESDTNGLAGARAYRKRLRLKKQDLENATAVGLSSIDSSGYEEFFGPFELGQEYGQAASFEPINWSSIREEYSQNMREAGFVFAQGRWLKSTNKRVRRTQRLQYQLGREVVSMSVAGSGIQRVTFSEVQQSGAEFAGVSLDELAVTYKGEPVARLIASDDTVFNEGDELIFYARELAKADQIYTTESVYRIQRDSAKVLEANIQDVTPANLDNVNSAYLKQYSQGENKLYVATSTSGDPWLDRKITAIGRASQTSYSFEVAQPILEQEAYLAVSLVGGIDFPSVAAQNPDHHVLVKVNGLVVADVRFDGFKDHQIDAVIPASVVVVGQNSVEVELPGDTGQVADILYVDRVSVSVPHRSELVGSQLIVQAKLAGQVLRVEGAGSAAQLFAYQSNGNFAQLVGAKVEDDALTFNSLDGVSEAETFYTVMTPEGFSKPSSITLERPSSLVKKLKADYLIVAHPAFINDDLERFADAKRDAGFHTKIISWLDIVETYGYGMPTPQAMRDFLKSADQSGGFSHLLVVGGHSYDYNDYLGMGNVNFIPTMYQTVSKHFVYAPTDALLVDLDSDGLPDKAIGRWPVRTTQDLSNIVNKTLRWQADSESYLANTLLIADVTDSARGQNFADQLNDVAAAGRVDLGATNVSQIYLDRYLEQATSNPFEEAKSDLLDHFAAGAPGVGMTIYNGHSSSSRWTFRNLLNAGDIADFDNASAPTFVLPLACYTTLYESPTVDTLAHQLLFENEGGAVALTGAAYLSEYRENAAFAKRLLRGVGKRGRTIGQAILKQKNAMKPWNDMVTNWSYLGDPSLSFSAD